MNGWLLLLAPLVSAVVVLGFLRRSPAVAQIVSIGACLVSFCVAVGLWTGSVVLPAPWLWIDLPGLKVEIGILADSLARLMLMVVTGVGLLIHLFSVGYMSHDPSRARFFGKLSLFMFSMIGIVVSTNLVMMFIFWELVGLSSYLLIGFWFEKPAAAEAAKKAFLTNRIGDFGFMLGILLYWTFAGTVAFSLEVLPRFRGLDGMMTAMALLLFCGCVGKSAMLPLHVWLPDAMEGPTPVSALIHAATMVAAGVYMLCRLYPVLALSAMALQVISVIGCATAIFAALIATQQNDIKKILAYSTLSQLGYMVMAVGIGSPVAAMYHLTTHAFFKALLFLGAGSVIYSLHHEQNIWSMGGLRKKMPATYWTFLLGVLALCGVWPFSGFHSKEEILLAAYGKSGAIFTFAVMTASLTTFYMLRLFFIAFEGKPRSEAALHAHESPAVMTFPLMVLAALSVGAGYFDIPALLGSRYHYANKEFVVACSMGALAVGVAAAGYLYWNRQMDPIQSRILIRKFFVDEIYEAVLIRGQQLFARLLNLFDAWVLGMAVRLTAFGVTVGGEILRLIQTGNLQGYAFFFSVGVLGILYYALRGI